MQSVRNMRLARGLTRGTLALMAGLTHTTIYNAESGRHLPSPRTLALLQRVERIVLPIAEVRRRVKAEE